MAAIEAKNRQRSYTATVKLLAFLLTALALLVCDTAAGLASGLAGGLAFAATAVLSAFAEILGIESLNVLHTFLLRNDCIFYDYITTIAESQSRRRIFS